MFGTLSIPLGRAAIFGTLSVETDAFSPTVQKHIYEYGLRQILNDAMAEKKDESGEKLPDDQIVAKAQKRLDALRAGNLRARSEAEPADPIDRMVLGFCREALLAQWRAKGEFVFPKGTKNRFLFVANSLQAKAGKKVFDSEIEYLRAVLSAAPKRAEKWRAQAEETLNEKLEIEL